MTCDLQTFSDDETDHSVDLRTCPTCNGTFCKPCRAAVKETPDRCPNCNGYVGDAPSCRTGGGCGV